MFCTSPTHVCRRGMKSPAIAEATVPHQHQRTTRDPCVPNTNAFHHLHFTGSYSSTVSAMCERLAMQHAAKSNTEQVVLTLDLMEEQKSLLAGIPLEIRHSIYSYILPSQIHVCFRDGRLHLSPCQEPDKDPRSSCFIGKTDLFPSDGQERSPDGCAMTTPLWVRRLQSSWSPHWMCEELADSQQLVTAPLFLVCRQL